jgi:hypothetical protein
MSLLGDLSIGVVFLAVGVVLLLIGMPKQGVSPRYLRLDAAVVIYPAIILMFLAMGAAMMLKAHG